MQPEPHYVLAFGMPAGMEWIVVLVVALLIFGPRLPGVMRSLGGSIREFKKGVDTDADSNSNKDQVKPVDGAISRTTEPAPKDNDHKPNS